MSVSESPSPVREPQLAAGDGPTRSQSPGGRPKKPRSVDFQATHYRATAFEQSGNQENPSADWHPSSRHGREIGQHRRCPLVPRVVEAQRPTFTGLAVLYGRCPKGMPDSRQESGKSRALAPTTRGN